MRPPVKETSSVSNQPGGRALQVPRLTRQVPVERDAAISKQVQPGDYVLAVDGVNVAAGTNLDEQLMHKVGRRVELRVSAAADGGNARTVVVQPISGGAERTLLYRDWIESNRAYVDKMGTHLPARTVVGVHELPKPGIRMTMNLTAVTRE